MMFSDRRFNDHECIVEFNKEGIKNKVGKKEKKETKKRRPRSSVNFSKRQKIDPFDENYRNLYYKYLEFSSEIFTFYQLHIGFMKQRCNEEIALFNSSSEWLNDKFDGSVKLSRIAIQSNLKDFSKALFSISKELNGLFFDYYQEKADEDDVTDEELSLNQPEFSSRYLNMMEKKKKEKDYGVVQPGSKLDLGLQRIEVDKNNPGSLFGGIFPSGIHPDQLKSSLNQSIDIFEESAEEKKEDYDSEELEIEEEEVEEEVNRTFEIPKGNSHTSLNSIFAKYNYKKMPESNHLSKQDCVDKANKLKINFTSTCTRSIILEKIFLYYIKKDNSSSEFVKFLKSKK